MDVEGPGTAEDAEVVEAGGGRGRGNNTHVINGIDVSDPTRNFSAQEWETLGPANRALVMEMRNRANGQERGTGGRGRGQGRGRGNETAGRSATISAVTFDNESEQNDGQSETMQSERGGRNGRGFGRGAYGPQNRS